MSQRSLLDHVFEIASIQADTTASVRAHEKAISDLQDRTERMEREFLHTDELTSKISAAVVDEVARTKEKWWLVPVKQALGVIAATAILALTAFFFGHLQITWKPTDSQPAPQVPSTVRVNR